MDNKRILIAITGASGSIYAQRLLEELSTRVSRIYVVASTSGEAVVQYELPRKSTGPNLLEIVRGKIAPAYKDQIKVFKNDDFFAPVASGSSAPTHMIVIPCSMGSLARIRHGLSMTLVERAADVVIKERKELIICPRESPFSEIHLENMLALAKMGVRMLPLMPSFYQHPKSLEDAVNTMVGKLLETLGYTHDLYSQWDKRRL